jgi:hypothetical protein
MATAVGLNMKITADTAGVGRGVDETNRKLSQLGQGAQQASGGLGGMFGSITGGNASLLALGAATGGAAVVVDKLASSVIGAGQAMVQSFISAIERTAAALIALEDEVETLSRVAVQIGVTFEEVQVLAEAAERTGASIQDLGNAMVKFNQRIAEARTGAGGAADAFRQIGISAEELRTIAPDQLAQVTAERLLAIEDPAKRAALAMELFGRSGETILRTVGEIEKARASLERFGGIISSEDQERISALGDSIDNLGVSMGALQKTFLTPLVGAFAGVLDVITSITAVATSALAPIMESLQPIFDLVGDALARLAQGFEKVGNRIQELLEKYPALTEALTVGIEGALMTVVYAIDGLLLILDEFIRHIDAVDEALRYWITSWNDFVDSLPPGFEGLKLVINTIEDVPAAADAAAEAIIELTDAQKRLIKQSEELARIETEFGGDRERAAAAERLAAINQEIAAIEQEIVNKRGEGDADAIKALQARLALLDQLAAREEDVASGAKKSREEYEKRLKKLQDELAANEKAAAAGGGAGAAADGGRVADGVGVEFNGELMSPEEFEAIVRQQNIDIFGAQADALTKSLEGVRNQSLETADIRSGGFSQFLDLALGRDPGLDEARKQTEQLKGIRKSIELLKTTPLDIPVVM